MEHDTGDGPIEPCAPVSGAPTAADVRETRFLDFSAPAVQSLLEEVTQSADSLQAAVSLWFAAVRDRILYDPYTLSSDPETYRASTVAVNARAYCVPKAVLFVAGCRSLGVPARLGFADVQNHLQTARLRAQMDSDIFRFHGYGLVWIENRWLKASPAFNRELCARFSVAPLHFDGRADALLHQFSGDGSRYMEYLTDHGSFADLPFDELLRCYRTHYPQLILGREDFSEGPR